MDNNIMMQLNNPKNWKRTRKKGYEVYVCRPNIGKEVTNKLEGAKYKTDQNKQFVISGTVGETWVIDAGKLAKTYTFIDGSPITPEALKSKMTKSGLIDWMHLKTMPAANAQTNWAFHLPLSTKNFPVQTSRGDTLYANRPGVGHGVGDFLVCSDAGGQPNLNDVWVVNGEVFPTTYDMRAFPGLITDNDKLSETPVPKSILDKDELGTIKEKGESRRVQYQIVGRYMDGSDVTGYHIQSIETGKSGRYTKDQICFLVGRGQITNCTAQLYQDKVLLRGNGMRLEDLPIIREDGELRNSDGLGKIRKGTSAAQAVEMFNIIGTVKAGRNTVGYVIQNAGCGIKKVKRAQVIQLAQQGKIGNARVQNYNGQILLRGVGVNLDDLPSEIIDMQTRTIRERTE